MFNITSTYSAQIANANSLLFSTHSDVTGTVFFYKSDFITQGQQDLVKLPKSVKDSFLVSIQSSITNPFKNSYLHFYTNPVIELLKSKCPFVGVNFELDGNNNTQEWLVTTNIGACNSKILDSENHIWIIQKEQNKNWRVLMESDATLTAKTIKVKSYKQLWTEHYVNSFSPKSGLGCGRVALRWNYLNGRYRIIKQGIDYGDCSSKFVFDRPESGYNDAPDYVSEAENTRRKRQAEAKVKVIANQWLQTLKAFR